MIVERDRLFVDLTIEGPVDARAARFWIDSGGGGFVICEPLAAEVGLQPVADAFDAQGHRLAPTTAPTVRLSGTTLDLDRARCFIDVGRSSPNDLVEAEGILPGHVLSRYRVTLDYPDGQIVLNGDHGRRQDRMIGPVEPRSGFVVVTTVVADESFRCCWIPARRSP